MAAVAVRPSTGGGRRYVRPSIEQRVPMPDSRPGTSAGERTRSSSHSAAAAVKAMPSGMPRQVSEGTGETLATVRSDKKRVTHAGTMARGSLKETPEASKTMPLRQTSQEDIPEVVRSDKKRATHSGTPFKQESRDVSKTRGMPRQISKDSADVLHLPEVTRSARSSARERSDSKMSNCSSCVREEDHGKFQRRLSFIDCTTDDLDQLFHAEFGGADWFKHFWHTVLTQQPLCRALSNRSLTNWVMIYNNWQAAGKWNGQAPDYMNTYELQEWLAAPLTRVLELVKLFDPSGYAKVSMTKATQDYNKVRVPVLPLISVCVIMSHTMSVRQKLQFILGLFDLEDADALSINEFTGLWVNLVRGLHCAFGVKEPPLARNVAMAARKIFGQLSLGDEKIPKKHLLDFLSGKICHPLGLPFGLVMQRFSVDVNIIDPDSYLDERQRFRLSHKKAMENPLESYSAQDNAFLTRAEVVVARDVFQYCHSTGDYSLSHTDAEKAIGKAIHVDLWCSRMSRALEEASALQGRVGFELNTFLKKLCPRATPAHLQMFQCWLQDFDKLEKQKVQLERSKQMLADLRTYQAQPVMTERVRQELITGFHLVDRMNLGRVCTTDLQASMEVEKDTAKSMMRYFDTNGDGFVDMEEYIAAMCPEGHRMPSKVQDRIFDLILSAEVERREELVRHEEALFNKPPTERKSQPFLKAAEYIQKQVPDMVWEDWNAAWEILDNDQQGFLTRGKLRKSRAMRMEVSDFMFDLIAGSQEAESISKEQFQAKLLESSHFRPRGVNDATVTERTPRRDSGTATEPVAAPVE